jgi:hypothetical protein
VTDYTDACPACAPGDPPASLPVGTPEQVPGGILTAHQCSLCETAWNTFWRDAWPVDRLLAPVTADQAARNRKALDEAMKGRAA